MAKKAISTTEYLHQRGEVKESVIKALVTDPLFKTRVERNRKGKGSYQRKAKHHKDLSGESPFKNVRLNGFKWAFFICFFHRLFPSAFSICFFNWFGCFIYDHFLIFGFTNSTPRS